MDEQAVGAAGEVPAYVFTGYRRTAELDAARQRRGRSAHRLTDALSAYRRRGGTP